MGQHVGHLDADCFYVSCERVRLPHVYMLTQPASHYYRIMTRHDRMPVLLGQQM